MKQNRNLINSLVGCAIALALVSTAAAQGAMDGAAKVVRVSGPARFTTGNNVWQPLHVGDVLHAGTVIQTSTEEGSYVDLALGDGHASVPMPVTYHATIPNSTSSGVTFKPNAEQDVVRIWANTALGIDKLTMMQTGADNVTETQLDLKQGRISGSVKKMSAASKYEVKLPNGVAGVRGTVYDIQAVGIVKVYIGSMVVAWVDPKTQNVTTQTVMGGQAYDAPNNQVSPLSPASMSELQSLASSMLVGGGAGVVETTLAIDRAVVGMSPVGANPASLPTPVQD
jgi:FecR protein